MNRIKRGATIWAVAGALLLAWSGFSWGANMGAEDRADDDRAKQEQLMHFYRVVAGDLSGQEPGPANKLARDLREIPVEDIETFTGDSNRYGGITDELGFDPFNGVNCSECGELDTQVVFDIQDIKDGELNTVLERLEDEIEPADTVAGPPGFLWAVWLISLPALAFALHMRERRSVESRYQGVIEERKLLEQLHQAREELPVGGRDWMAIAALEERLEEQIETRVNYKKSKTQEMKLERLMTEASDALESIAAGNKALN